jgi:hypothetical protein
MNAERGVRSASEGDFVIEVTMEDILRGRLYIASKCPIALAAQRATRASISITFSLAEQFWPSGAWVASLNELGRFVEMRLPPEAEVFAQRFDSELAVYPFSFVLPGSAALREVAS